MNKKIIVNFILLLQFLLTISLYAQKTYIIETTEMTFKPANLTVNIGDTVKWINTSKGLHNVIADDESFSSGDPSMEEWTFVNVFLKKGNNPYYCSIHGSKGGFGMSGSILVKSKSKD